MDRQDRPPRLIAMRTSHPHAPMRRRLATTTGGALLAALVLALILSPSQAQANYCLDKKWGFTLCLGVKAALGGIATGNTNFGAGTVRPDGSVEHDVKYGEGYILPRLDLTYDAGNNGTFYGAVAAVAAGTRGGDPANFTTDSPSDLDLDQAYGGWKSGKLFPSLGDDAIDISAGQEYFGIGDGFLIWDGHFDAHGDAAYWLAPRQAYDMAGVIKLATKPVSGSVFYLKGDVNQDSSQLAGGNIEYANETLGTFGATYFQVFNSDDSSFIRDGMNVGDVRAWDVPVPLISDFKLRGEFAHEWGDDHGITIDANGWYAAITWTMPNILNWGPTLTYRYSSFSGDDDPLDGNSNAFDPLFYYSPSGWGTWYQGEIVGEYLLFNSNEIAHMVKLDVNPTSTLNAGLLFFDFSLDKNSYFGTPVSDRHFADEADIYVNWSITPQLALSVVGALAWPGEAAKEVFGNDETYELIESSLTFTY